MKKILTFFVILGLIIPFLPLNLKADGIANIDVSITYIFEEGNEVESDLLDQVYGSTITPTPASLAGYTFKYWVVNGIVRADLPENNTFYVTSSMNLVGLYSPDATNVVVYMDSNGKILSTEYLADGFTGTPPTTNLPTKPGLTIADPAWKNMVTNSTSLVITDDSVFALQYVSASADTYTLTVDGTLEGTYAHNAVATLVAAPTQGADTFSHWEENGVVLSRSLQYTFTMLNDRVITKVYLNVPLIDNALVTLSPDLEIRDGYHTYLGQFYIPAAYDIVEYGFLIHTDNTLDLTINTPGVTIAKANSLNPLTNEFMVSFLTGSHMNAKAYVIYDTGLALVEVYSSNSNIYLDWTIENFDEYPETSTSYNTGTFTSSTTNVIWDYTNSAGAQTIDGKSITLSGSSASLEATIPNGISDFKIDFRKAFSTDTGLKLFINDILVATSEKSTGDIVVFEVNNLDTEGTFTIKLIGDVKQTVIDNLSWVSYGPVTGFSPVINNTSDDTITEGDTYDPLVNVTASDVEDGDLTSEITYIAKDNLDNVIPQPIDFSSLLFGDYTITYSVVDSDSNTTEVIINLTILEPVHYTVDFIENGGSAVADQSIVNGSLATEPADPTKTDFYFSGWFTDDTTFLVPYSFETIVSEDTTLYARWTPNGYSYDLFISEYIEGSGTTRALEIYNNTGSTINLANYSIRQYNNGSSTISYELSLPDFDLLHGQTYVIYHTSSVEAITTAAQTADGYLGTSVSAINFNGDDAIALAKSGTNVDVIGKIGVDPGSSWTASLVSTANMTLVRKATILNGDSDGSNDFDPSIEWIAYATDTADYLGSHTVGE
ncbi:InlB B-repeat-containing protein [Mariniplasma anaerobium]|nr:InlB B-repeat-containing protein [Mariniplasma anaerobium]